jgi:hypothetical protein
MHSTRAGDITTVAECSALAGRMGLKYWAGAEKDQAGQPGGCFRYEGTSSFAQYNGLYFNTNLAGVETGFPDNRYSVCNDAQYEAILYRVLTTKAMGPDAAQLCANVGAGWGLASIKTNDESTAVNAAVVAAVGTAHPFHLAEGSSTQCTSSTHPYPGRFNSNPAGTSYGCCFSFNAYPVCSGPAEAPAPTPAPPAGVKCPDSQGVGDVTTAAECIALAGRMGIKFHTPKNESGAPGGCYQYHTTGTYAQYNGLYFNLNLAGRSSWANPGKYSVCSGA